MATARVAKIAPVRGATNYELGRLSVLPFLLRMFYVTSFRNDRGLYYGGQKTGDKPIDNQPNLDLLAVVGQLVTSLEGESQDEILAGLAQEYVPAGLVDDAVNAADLIHDPFLRDSTIAEIAVGGIAHGADPLELIDIIDEPGTRAQALEQVSIAYAQSGDFQKASESAADLDDTDPVMSAISLAAAERDVVTQADTIAQSIVTPDIRATTLAELGWIAVRKDKPERAVELAAQASRVAAEIDFPQVRIYATARLAELYGELGNEEQARGMLADALHLSQSEDNLDSESLNSFSKDEALAQIAPVFMRLKRYAEADAVMEQIEDPFHFSSASIQQALEFGREGNREKMRELLAEVREIIEGEEVYSDPAVRNRDALLGQLSLAFATADDYEQAEQVANLMAVESMKSTGLTDLGRYAAQANRVNWVFHFAETFSDSYQHALYLLAIVDAFVSAEQLDQARNVAFRIVESLEKIEDASQRKLIQIEAGFWLAKVGEKEKGLQLLLTTAEEIAVIDDDLERSRALLTLANRHRNLDHSISTQDTDRWQKIISVASGTD